MSAVPVQEVARVLLQQSDSVLIASKPPQVEGVEVLNGRQTHPAAVAGLEAIGRAALLRAEAVAMDQVAHRARELPPIGGSLLEVADQLTAAGGDRPGR